MKELVGTARNLAIVQTDSSFKVVAELILVVSEPTYKFTCGEMERERETETIRLSTDSTGIKRLLSYLTECGYDIAKMEKQAKEGTLYMQKQSSKKENVA